MTPDNQSEAVRNTIIMAARECFAEQGLKQTTYACLAEASGFSQVEIKSLFKTKELLALAVQFHELELLHQDYITRMPDASLDESIKFVLRTRIEFVEKNQDRTILFFKNAFAGRQPWSSLFDQLIWQLSVEFVSLFEKSIRDGYLKKHIDINIAVRSITSFYLTGLVMMGLRASQLDADAVWDFIEPQIDLLLNSLKT